MIYNIFWSGIFWLEMLILYSMFEVDRKTPNPHPTIGMSREKRNRARAVSNAETSLARAAQRGRISAAAPARHPSSINLSGAFAKNQAGHFSTHHLTAAATTSLSQINEDEMDFEFRQQIRESACMPKVSEEDYNGNPKRRKRAGTCPGFGVDRVVFGSAIANEYGEFAGNLPSPSPGCVGPHDPAASEVTNLLESRTSVDLEDEEWQETQEYCESETDDSIGMMLLNTAGAGRGSASPEFRAYLQRAFKAEQEAEMRASATVGAVEELDFDPLPPTTHIREKAKEFLRELQESPPPDLQDLLDAFTGLDDVNLQASYEEAQHGPNVITRACGAEAFSVRERVLRLEMPIVC